MDGLLSLLFGVVLFAAALGFWTWRRSVRAWRAIANERSDALALSRIAAQSTARATGAAPMEDVRGASGVQDVQGVFCPKNEPTDDAATQGISREAGPSARPLGIVSQAPLEHELQRDPAGGYFGAEGLAALPASPPTIAGVPSGEQADDAPPLDRCATAVAEDKEPTRGHAAEGATLIPTEPPLSETQPEADRPSPIAIASGSPAPDIADPTKAADSRAPNAIDNIPAGPADAAQSDAIADSVAAGAVLFLPTKPRPSDEGADRAVEPIDGPDQEEASETAATGDDNEQNDARPEANATSSMRPAQPAIHRDRRGSRRAAPPVSTPPVVLPIPPASAARPPAEAKLRLSLHPIRRTASLSVVLARPDGFPQHVTLYINGQTPIEAYNAQRYDDLDLPWTSELLEGELRIASAEGFQWLRSARQVHIFAEDPSEPDLISVGAARPDVAHTVICRSGDAAAVSAAAVSTGSPEPATYMRWQGIPDGWTVLSGYTPVHASVLPLAAGLQPLDPGAGIEISFEGGLAIRPRVFAEGHPPRVVINPAPSGAAVTIGGLPAVLASDGGWEAAGWDRPGRHMVDVVPGPSFAYEIAADPWSGAGWEFWNAHADRFGGQAAGPWARAEICGAGVRGPAGQVVLAAETQPTLIALGARSGAAPLQPRTDVSVSVGFISEPPAFLISTAGPRRKQGRVIWLGLMPPTRSSTRPDPVWAAAVRAAASRRLPLEHADLLGEDVWRKAKERARRLKRPRQ